MADMKKAKMSTGALSGGLMSLALAGLFFLGQQLFDLPLVPFDIFDWLARVLPGDVITLGIDSIVSIIDTLNLLGEALLKGIQEILHYQPHYFGLIFYIVVGDR